MTIPERLTVIETEIKFIKKLIYLIFVGLGANAGIQII